MSDLGRKDFTEKVVEEIKPDSQKTFGEQVSENVTDGVDKVAAAAQPESEKSTTQKLGDNAFSGVDSAKEGGKTVLESAQDITSGFANVASEKIKAVGAYVTANPAKDGEDVTD